MKIEKAYTPVRRFYAYVGFVVILAAIVIGVIEGVTQIVALISNH